MRNLATPLTANKNRTEGIMEMNTRDQEVAEVLLHFGITEKRHGAVFYQHLLGIMRVIARESPIKKPELYGCIKFEVGINEERAKEYLRALSVKGLINSRFDDVVWIGLNGNGDGKE